MRKALLAVFLFAIAGAGASAQGGTPKPKTIPGRVAVVNIPLVAKKCNKAIDAANLVRTMKEVQAAIKTVAVENGIDLVFGYGDPLAKDLDKFPDVNRKMQAMDLGSSVPLAVAPNVDISEAVIDVLNKKQRAAGPKLGTDHVAVVNIGQVLNEYSRAKQFKAELERSILPYKREGKKLTDNIDNWQKAVQLGKAEDVDGVRFDAKIAQAKQRIEEIKAEVSRALGKKQEENLVQLWKEDQGGTKNYSRVQGIDLVIQHGDVIDKGLLDEFPNVNRKMQAMDVGSIVPLFYSTKRDISRGVVGFLNQAIDPQTTQVHVTRVGYFFELSVGISKPNESPIEVEKVKDLLAPARVRVVNVGLVFNKFEKAIQFKKELEEQLAPYKEKSNVIGAKIKVLEEKIRNGADNEKQLQATIKKHKRDLEDMSAEISSALGTAQEKNLVLLWKEMQAGIRTYATKNNVDVVFGYGDPMAKDLLHQFPNVKRKMDAMANGSTAPLFVSPRTEIGEAVAELLNNQYRESQK